MSRRPSKDVDNMSPKRQSLSKPGSNRTSIQEEAVTSRRASRQEETSEIQNVVNATERRSSQGAGSRRTSKPDESAIVAQTILEEEIRVQAQPLRHGSPRESEDPTPKPVRGSLDSTKSPKKGSLTAEEAPEPTEPTQKPVRGSLDSTKSPKKGSLTAVEAPEPTEQQVVKPLVLPIKPLPATDPSWLSKRIMCVGVCNFDIFHVVDKYPDEDTKSRGTAGWWARGGNPSNSCTVLALLGAKCEFLGVLSTQPAFRALSEDFRKRGIYIKNCPGVAQDPPFASVILEEGTGTRTIVISNPNFPMLTYEDFKKIDLNDYSWIHFEGRNPDETCPMIMAIRDFNACICDKIIISLELERLSSEVMGLTNNVDYVFLGKELAQFNGWNDAKTAAYGLRDKIKATPKPAIIVTWGAQGADCLDSEGNYARCHGIQIDNVVDSCGAGDTFLAAVIFAMVHMNLGLKHAIDYSNMITAYKLQHKGFDAIAKFKKRTGGQCCCKTNK